MAISCVLAIFREEIGPPPIMLTLYIIWTGFSQRFWIWSQKLKIPPVADLIQAYICVLAIFLEKIGPPPVMMICISSGLDFHRDSESEVSRNSKFQFAMASHMAILNNMTGIHTVAVSYPCAVNNKIFWHKNVLIFDEWIHTDICFVSDVLILAVDISGDSDKFILECLKIHSTMRYVKCGCSLMEFKISVFRFRTPSIFWSWMMYRSSLILWRVKFLPK